MAAMQEVAQKAKDKAQSFGQATNWQPQGEGRFIGDVAPIWAQGRSVYGGVVGASMARAMARSLPEPRPLRSMSLTFVGPLEAGVAECSAELLRHGRTASFAQGTIAQGDTTRAIASATYGAARGSSLSVKGPERPDSPRPEALTAMPYIDGIMPRFTQWLEFRWAQGDFPYSGSSESHIGGWMRFRFDTDPANEWAILGLLDAWPAPALSTLRMPAPASSISWNVDFVAARPDARIDQWWYFDAKTSFAEDGYTSFEASLWAPDGGFVARSRQLVGIWEAGAVSETPQ